MKRKIVLVIPAACLAVASVVKADTWSAAVLYPLNLPGGFTSDTPSGSSQPATGGQVVGYASNANDHAMLWAGPSGTATDLNPTVLTGITSSYANGTNGTQQAGYG